jgi:2-amino-4-hydroxy-6-hydroxymethyldihydropteridine diphosphokinase
MILIALGANLPSRAGGPSDTLRAAIASLGARGITVESQSGFYLSPAWPDPTDPAFVNAVVRVKTALAPAELLRLMHEIEDFFGRERGARNAPRVLDLDLIDYDGRVEQGPPERAGSRGFVLIPLRDVAPNWRHPLSGRTVSELIGALPQAEVTLLR